MQHVHASRNGSVMQDVDVAARAAKAGRKTKSAEKAIRSALQGKLASKLFASVPWRQLAEARHAAAEEQRLRAGARSRVVELPAY